VYTLPTTLGGVSLPTTLGVVPPAMLGVVPPAMLGVYVSLPCWVCTSPYHAGCGTSVHAGSTSVHAGYVTLLARNVTLLARECEDLSLFYRRFETWATRSGA